MLLSYWLNYIPSCFILVAHTEILNVALHYEKKSSYEKYILWAPNNSHPIAISIYISAKGLPNTIGDFYCKMQILISRLLGDSESVSRYF